MLYLIDGYNLIHAMGGLKGTVGPTGLKKARLGLLGLLHGTYGEESSSVTVVFDAGDAPAEAAKEQDYQGIHVIYARGPGKADGLIENLVKHASAPKNLTVVSDDHDIQQAARRRHCIVQGCEEYLAWLDRHRRERKAPPFETNAKPLSVSQQEKEDWLRQFSDPESDHALKEMSDPYGFLS